MQCRDIGKARIHAAVSKVDLHFIQSCVGFQRCSRGQLFHEMGMGGTCLHANRMAIKSGQQRRNLGDACKVGILSDDNLVCEFGVAGREVDFLLAVGGDRHARDNDVELFGLQRRNQAVKCLNHKHTFHRQLGAQHVAHVGVKAGDSTVGVGHAPRRVCAFGADLQLTFGLCPRCCPSEQRDE